MSFPIVHFSTCILSIKRNSTSLHYNDVNVIDYYFSTTDKKTNSLLTNEDHLQWKKLRKWKVLEHSNWTTPTNCATPIANNTCHPRYAFIIDKIKVRLCAWCFLFENSTNTLLKLTILLCNHQIIVLPQTKLYFLLVSNFSLYWVTHVLKF